MSSTWISAVRSVALDVPDLKRALSFYTDVWCLQPIERTDEAIYLRGAGDDHHLLALHQGAGAPAVRHITLRARSTSALQAVARAAELAGGCVTQPICEQHDDPAGGMGLTLRDRDGRLFRIVYGDARPIPVFVSAEGPLRLAHVVLNCHNLASEQRFIEQALDFRLTDRTRHMAFLNCNQDHHTLALADANNNALNHIAFLMPSLDAVMRGAGRMRDHGYPIEWGPGRHGPGNNTFSYFIDPFGVVIEYTAEVEQVDDSYVPLGPADWTWPAGRLDQWGIGTGPTARLREAQQAVFFLPSQARSHTP